VQKRTALQWAQRLQLVDKYMPHRCRRDQTPHACADALLEVQKLAYTSQHGAQHSESLAMYIHFLTDLDLVFKKLAEPVGDLWGYLAIVLFHTIREATLAQSRIASLRELWQGFFGNTIFRKPS